MDNRYRYGENGRYQSAIRQSMVPGYQRYGAARDELEQRGGSGIFDYRSGNGTGMSDAYKTGRLGSTFMSRVSDLQRHNGIRGYGYTPVPGREELVSQAFALAKVPGRGAGLSEAERAMLNAASLSGDVAMTKHFLGIQQERLKQGYPKNSALSVSADALAEIGESAPGIAANVAAAQNNKAASGSGKPAENTGNSRLAQVLGEMTVGQRGKYFQAVQATQAYGRKPARKENGGGFVAQPLALMINPLGALYDAAKAVDKDSVEKFEGDVAEAIATSPAARRVIMGLQGINESYLNPVGQIQRLYNLAQGNGYRTSYEHFEARDALEHAIEVGTQAAYEAIPLITLGAAAATSRAITGMSKSGNKLLRGAAKTIQYLGGSGIEGAQLGGVFGASALPVAVDLQQPKENSPLLEKALFYLGNLALSVLGGFTAGGLGLATSAKVNNYKINRGSRELRRQLETQEWADIDYGRFPRETLWKLNAIRYDNQVPLMKDNKLMIPANVSKHIYERRVIENRKSPKDVAQWAQKSFHSKQSVISSGNKVTNQEMRNVGVKNSEVGYLSYSNDIGKNIIVSVMKKDNKRFK